MRHRVDGTHPHALHRPPSTHRPLSTPQPLPRYVEVENAEVLRAYLRSSTFVSGSSEPGYKERRGYRGQRRRS